jgi:hypothetical protein
MIDVVVFQQPLRDRHHQFQEVVVEERYARLDERAEHRRPQRNIPPPTVVQVPHHVVAEVDAAGDGVG